MPVIRKTLALAVIGRQNPGPLVALALGSDFFVIHKIRAYLFLLGCDFESFSRFGCARESKTPRVEQKVASPARGGALELLPWRHSGLFQPALHPLVSVLNLPDH